MVVLGGLLTSLAAVAAVRADRAQATGEADTSSAQAASSSHAAVAATSADPRAPGVDTPAVPSAPLFARVGGLELTLPAEEAVTLGFHEAATREPLALQPVGTVIDHQNTTKFDPPAPDPAGSDYLVLSSRGRPMPATSAADVVLSEGVPVRAPVDGEVTDVREYHLYGKHLDQRIEIVPDAAPELRLVMIHVDGAAVAVGDRVVAGETVLAAQARRFPFPSHIDRYTEPHRHGHVHLEVKPAAAPRPGEAAADDTTVADDAAADDGIQASAG